MKLNKYIVALDSGTSSCRALLVDYNANIIDISQKEFTQIFPSSGWVEHDAEEIWKVQYEVFEDLVRRNKILPEQITGIGITNQRETTVVWSKSTGTPICNAIVWQDRRTSTICEEIKMNKIGEYIMSVTGLVIDAYFSGTKIKWILDNVSGAQEKALQNDLCFGTIDSWLIYKMTVGKKHVTDFTNASRTLLFNIKDKVWDKSITEYLNIPDSMLPEVMDSSSHFGDFEYKGYNIPICGVAGDQQAALFGQACFEPGSAKNTYGTGCFLLMNIGDKFIRSKNGLLTTLCCDKFGKATYALEGSIFIAGAAIQWLRDGLGVIESNEESEIFALKAKDKNEVIVVPAFTGLGAPYWNMYARGAMFGLTRSTGMNEIIKATVDSLAYRTRDVLDAMVSDSQVRLSVLNVDGGVVKNNYLMQFQSDILQVDVDRPEVTETTAMGVAYLAGIHLNIWDYNSILDKRKLERKFIPTIDLERSNNLYRNWKKAVLRTVDWMDKDDQSI